jgi:hypothetical protein
MTEEMHVAFWTYRLAYFGKIRVLGKIGVLSRVFGWYHTVTDRWIG